VVDLEDWGFTQRPGTFSAIGKGLILTFDRLLQAGCSKVFITSRKAGACDEAVVALNALTNKQPSARAYSVPADSSKVSEIERLVKEVEKHTDHVDILFANAGATWGSEFDKVDEKNGWDKIMDLNVKGVFFTIQK
jgi:NAD(P)-dependent dehydrogenase (short-subunit alcohol dehydrogenase family)